MSESAVSAKPRLGLVWRETGAVRNARPSRGQAASTRKRAQWEKDGVAFRLRLNVGCGGLFPGSGMDEAMFQVSECACLFVEGRRRPR